MPDMHVSPQLQKLEPQFAELTGLDDLKVRRREEVGRCKQYDGPGNCTE